MKLPPFSFFLGLAVAVLVSVFIWKFLGAPVSMVDAPAGKVHCISYAPYRMGESPLDAEFRVNPANIDEDLALLSKVTDCVRTYSVGSGLDQVPALAQKHGLKVMQGIWIGAEDENNEAQIALALKLAGEYRQTIKSIVIGNEVLLRGEQTPEALIAYLERVRTATDIPVTYADVTDFWLKAPPELAAAVDFITIHILPYWENDPRSAAEGVAYLDQVREEVAEQFPGREVFIGETGFPSAGRQRAKAVPSLTSQARYLRELADYAETHNLDYNLIEAFDQPWKRELEGTVGGHWGVFTTDRQQKFPWTGPVSQYENWQQYTALAIALSALLLGLMMWRGQRLEELSMMIAGAGAGAAASAFMLQIEHSWLAWQTPVEAAGEILLGFQSLAVLILLLPELTKKHNAAAPLPVSQTLDFLRKPKKEMLSISLYLGLLRLLATCSALVISLGLSFNGRYLDFPIAAFALPALSFALLCLMRRDLRKAPPQDQHAEALLATLLVATSIAIMWNEGAANSRALIWCCLNLLLAFPWVRIWYASVRASLFNAATAPEK